HGPHQRCCDECFARGPLGQELRIVPAIADLILIGAGGALYDELRRARDGGGEMFRHPGFGGAWYAEDEERPIGYERRNRCFDEAAVSDIFWRDLDAGFGLAAHEISDDG